PCSGVAMKVPGALTSWRNGASASARSAEAPAKIDQARVTNGRRVAADLDDNAEAIAILKKSGPIGITFLLAYIAVGARPKLAAASMLVSPYQWAALLTLLVFFGLSWLPGFRAHWRLWSLLCCVTIIALMIEVSAASQDQNARYTTIILCPFATAAFV